MLDFFSRITARIIAFLTAITVSIVGGANPKTIETGEITTILTQTAVVQSRPGYNFNLYEYFANITKGFTIPGLYEGFIPQGFFYEENNDIFLISGYYEDEKLPSRIVVVNGEGKLVKSVGLISGNGNYAYGHFGGISVFGDNVYIASTSVVHVTSLEKILSAENDSYVPIEAEFYPDVEASYTNVYNGVLYIGEFQLEEEVNPRCNAYILDENCKYAIKSDKITSDGKIIEDYTFLVPIKIQGIITMPDGRFVLSSSYGAKNYSVIYVYNNFTKYDADSVYESENGEIPYYTSIEEDLLNTYQLPPYVEEMAFYSNGKVYVLSESAADPYRKKDKNIPIDFIMKWDINRMH